MTRYQIVLATLSVLLILTGVLMALPSWFWHPLGYCPASMGRQAQIACKSYNFHSGIEGNIPLVGFFIGQCVLIAQAWHRHNCHHVGCLRVVRHTKTHCPKHESEAA